MAPTADRDGAAPGRAARVDGGPRQRHRAARHGDDPAIGEAGTGIDRARHVRIATGGIAIEDDPAGARDERGCAYLAAVVDHARGHRIRTARGEDDHAAGGADHAAIADERVRNPALDTITDEAVAGEIERHGVARGQHGAAARAGDRAAVRHRRSDQRDHAAAGGGDLPFVGDRACAGAPGQPQPPRRRIRIGQVERRGDEATDIDRRALAEQDTARIEQPYLAVGGQMAEDLAGAAAGDAIDREAGGVGLMEDDAGVGADVKPRPVGDDRRAALMDVHPVRRRGDRAGALDDRAAGRQRGTLCPRRAGERERQQRGDHAGKQCRATGTGQQAAAGQKAIGDARHDRSSRRVR